MAGPFVPSGNVTVFPYRHAGTPLVRRLQGLFRGADAHPMTGIQDNGADIAHRLTIDPDTRRQLVDKHIGIVRQLLQSKNPPVALDQVAEERARAAALSVNSTDPGTIANTVLTAATGSLPNDAQAALRNELQSRGISEGEYYAALARFGASASGSIDSLMATYRAARAREAGGDGPYGNNSYVNNPGSVSMGNYMSTPYASTGITHSTFSYLRDELRAERFSGQNILHAGQDARRHGFSPNDRPVVRDFAILDRDDGARRDETNRIYGRYNSELASDAEIQRLRRELGSVQGEARRAIEEQLRARERVIADRTGMTGHIATAPTAAAGAVHTRNRDRFILRNTGLEAAQRAEVATDAVLAADNSPRLDSATIAGLRSDERRDASRTNDDLDAALLAAANPTRAPIIQTDAATAPSGAPVVHTASATVPTGTATARTGSVVAQNVQQRPTASPTLRV